MVVQLLVRGQNKTKYWCSMSLVLHIFNAGSDDSQYVYGPAKQGVDKVGGSGVHLFFALGN